LGEERSAFNIYDKSLKKWENKILKAQRNENRYNFNFSIVFFYYYLSTFLVSLKWVSLCVKCFLIILGIMSKIINCLYNKA